MHTFFKKIHIQNTAFNVNCIKSLNYCDVLCLFFSWTVWMSHDRTWRKRNIVDAFIEQTFLFKVTHNTRREHAKLDSVPGFKREKKSKVLNLIRRNAQCRTSCEKSSDYIESPHRYRSLWVTCFSKKQLVTISGRDLHSHEKIITVVTAIQNKPHFIESILERNSKTCC